MNRFGQYADAYDKLPRCITFLLEENPARATDDCLVAMADLDSDEQVRIAREVRNGNVATFDELVHVSLPKASPPVVVTPEVISPEAEETNTVEENETVQCEDVQQDAIEPEVPRTKPVKRKYVRRKKGRKKKVKKSTSWVIQCRLRFLRDKVDQLAEEKGGCKEQLAKCHATLDELIAGVKSMK